MAIRTALERFGGLAVPVGRSVVFVWGVWCNMSIVIVLCGILGLVLVLVGVVHGSTSVAVLLGGILGPVVVRIVVLLLISHGLC